MSIEQRTATTGRALYDTREAADYLGMSKSYLEQLRVAGGGPKFKVIPRTDGSQGKAVRYTRNALDDWVLNLPEFDNTTQAALRAV